MEICRGTLQPGPSMYIGASEVLPKRPMYVQSWKDVFSNVLYARARHSAQKLLRQTFAARIRSSAARNAQTGLDNT